MIEALVPLLNLLAKVVEEGLAFAIVDDADAVHRVITDGTVQWWNDIATLAVDDAHFAVLELHNSAVAAEVARPQIFIVDNNLIVLILKANASLRRKPSARLDNRVYGITLAVDGDAIQA